MGFWTGPRPCDRPAPLPTTPPAVPLVATLDVILLKLSTGIIHPLPCRYRNGVQFRLKSKLTFELWRPFANGSISTFMIEYVLRFVEFFAPLFVAYFVFRLVFKFVRSKNFLVHLE